MKVLKANKINSHTPKKVIDCFVDKGYLQGNSGSLPDVDVDYQSDRRQEVKEYIERRYNHDGKQRVFSAGTFTTLKLKAVLKDVSRVHRVPVNLVNYVTAIFDDDKMDWTDLFVLAATNTRVKRFIQDYPKVIEDIRTLMGQPRSSSVHASALLVTPDDKDGVDMECFDFTPIKKVDDILVSEWDGYTLDEQGLLKNDCLGIKELSKIQATLEACNEHYNANLTLLDIVQSDLNDEKVYQLFQDGYTQNIFQFSSKGMTKFVMEMMPTHIDDLIAANALFRPATLDSGAAQAYVDCKRGDKTPSYLWGTYETMKDTFGQLCYQEQLAKMSRDVGGLSLAEGVKLVKFISKKKQNKINEYKGKFMQGALSQGCPKDDAEKIWNLFEVAGSYCFNKSHSTAYAITAYIGAYLKAHYPTAFYTVALQWASDDDVPVLMNEMEMCSNAKIVAPDINVSVSSFFTDYETDKIYWSLSKIKMCGIKATNWIVEERNSHGKYTSIDNFIDRVFRYKLKKYEFWDDPDNPDESERCPVNARHICNLILAGCFDEIENVKSVIERYAILARAAERLGFTINEKDIPSDLKDKHYFWSQKQIEVSGIGAIDYKRIYDGSSLKPLLKGRVSYMNFEKVQDAESDGKKIAVCAQIADIEEKKYQDKKTGEEKMFCKVLLQQNTTVVEMTIWNEDWFRFREKFSNGNGILWSKNKILVCSAKVHFSSYSNKNAIQLYNRSLVEIF